MFLHAPRLPSRRRIYSLAIWICFLTLTHKLLSSFVFDGTHHLLPLWEVRTTWRAFKRVVHGGFDDEDQVFMGGDTNETSRSWTTPRHPKADSPAVLVAIEEELDRLFDAQPEWHPSLNGPPTPRFKDNLREDVKYVTGFAPGGWTNDVISLMNLIYLGIIMERVPILPPFAPDHMPKEAGFINVGDVFDVPALSEAIGIPVLEWAQVKDLSAAQLGDLDRIREQDDLKNQKLGNEPTEAEKSEVEVEQMGCWSNWMTFYPDSGPRPNKHESFLGLDVSYTASPEYVKLFPHMVEIHSSFWGLAALGFEEGDDVWKRQTKSPARRSHEYIQPDTQVTCFDYLYFVAGTKQIEINHKVSPAWRFVGKHLRWNRRMLDITEWHLRASLDVPDGAPLPPHITVHIRRTDFANMCNGVPKLECLAPLSAYAKRVEEVKKEAKARGLLRLRKRNQGSNIQMESDLESDLYYDKEKDLHDLEREVAVIVTSDEVDPEWWAEVHALGWKRVDYEKLDTERELGKWYPSLIDAVVQSTGVGLVGTDGSTMSTVAGLRLESWYGGAWKLVRWGRVGADDH